MLVSSSTALPIAIGFCPADSLYTEPSAPGFVTLLSPRNCGHQGVWGS